MAKIIVTGGAGYIGSHTIYELIKDGHEVVSIDNYSNSTDTNFDGLKHLTGKTIHNYNTDLADDQATRATFADIGSADAVIHLAAYKYVGESVHDPLKYYDNNIKSLLNILRGMQTEGIVNFVHSSSCTVYGNPDRLPVDENTPMGGTESPYGLTKQINEKIIADAAHHGMGLNAINLRYFNPAGIDSSGQLIETTTRRQETLVPIIQEVMEGKRDQLEVFGTDYDTRDGSPVRDYLHVSDLAIAHVRAVDYLNSNPSNNSNRAFNLGLGAGVTVIEMIQAAEKVYGRTLSHKLGPRREGDISAIYADITAANRDLKWFPQYGIEDIFRSIVGWSNT